MFAARIAERRVEGAQNFKAAFKKCLPDLVKYITPLEPDDNVKLVVCQDNTEIYVELHINGEHFDNIVDVELQEVPVTQTKAVAIVKQTLEEWGVPFTVDDDDEQYIIINTGVLLSSE